MSELLVSSSFPFIPLTVRIGDLRLDIEAYLDTGFSGALTLPPMLLPPTIQPIGETSWILADDSEVRAPFVTGFLVIPDIGLRLSVAITLIGSVPVAGRLLSDRLKVTLDHGRRLIIEP